LPIEVPSDKYWGHRRSRSIINFPIGWGKNKPADYSVPGVVKKSLRHENLNQGNLDQKRSHAINRPPRPK